MKHILCLLIVTIFSISLFAGSTFDHGLIDISSYSADNGRVLGSIERPGYGADVYMAHVEVPNFSKSILYLGNDADIPGIIEVRAHNFSNGELKPHIIRILPGQTLMLGLLSLGNDFEALQFCSLSPFSAEIVSLDGRKKTLVQRQDLVYAPPVSSEECEDDKVIENKIPVEAQSLNEIICSGTWTLSCATPATCGTYSVSDYGTVEAVWYSKIGWCYHVSWRNHLHYEGCFTYRDTTINDSGCTAVWSLNAGCPWYATNCYGEAYWVYR